MAWLLDLRFNNPADFVRNFMSKTWEFQYRKRSECYEWSEAGEAIVPYANARLQRNLGYLKKTQLYIHQLQGSVFQVQNEFKKEEFSVDMHLHECSCKQWQQTGVPCVEALAVWQSKSLARCTLWQLFHPVLLAQSWQNFFETGVILALPDSDSVETAYYSGKLDNKENYPALLPPTNVSTVKSCNNSRIGGIGDKGSKTQSAANHHKAATVCAECGKSYISKHGALSCVKRQQKLNRDLLITETLNADEISVLLNLINADYCSDEDEEW